MPFKNGNKQSVGRPKGSRNRATAVAKEAIGRAMNGSTNQLLKEMSELKGKEFVDAYCKLARFVLPTLSSKEVDVEVKSDVPQWIIELEDMPDDKVKNLLESKSIGSGRE